MILILQIILLLFQSSNIFSQRLFHQYRDPQKFLDIYTNYPNLEKLIKEQQYLDLFSRNKSRRHNSNKPLFIKLQSEKYTDNDSPQNENDYTDENDRSFTKNHESHVQKISSRSLTTNSKQLETNQTFFSKINSVIRDQFSRLFKFGGQKNAVESTSKMYENSRSPTKEAEEKLKDKKRFLNLFTILQFENSRCMAQAEGMEYEGTCFHKYECSRKEGISLGACAKGYGVCCIFRFTCGGYTSSNTSYFECDNTGGATPTTMPTTSPPDIDPRINLTAIINRYQFEVEWSRQNTGTSPCTFTVAKRKPDVKQLRIDFLDFDLRGPTNGTCSTDRLVITGNNVNMPIPVICGYNTGQHIYVDVGDVTGPIQLSVSTANPAEKRFRIRVSQIRAPCANSMNCMQYYTGPTGVIQTLNYNPSPRGFGPAQYFNNLNYAICIRKEPGYCSITYSNVQNGVQSPFSLINVDANGNMLIPPGQAGAEIFNCPDDYIVINGIRLCGDRFNDGSTTADFRQNAPVTDNTAGPYVIPVRTNGNNAARGFQLFYNQNRCT